MGPVHCSQDPQVLKKKKKNNNNNNNNNFKTGSHDTINIFKNYFVIVFSIFSNKRYPNRPLLTLKNNKEARDKRKIWKSDKEVEHLSSCKKQRLFPIWTYDTLTR